MGKEKKTVKLPSLNGKPSGEALRALEGFDRALSLGKGQATGTSSKAQAPKAPVKGAQAKRTTSKAGPSTFRQNSLENKTTPRSGEVRKPVTRAKAKEAESVLQKRIKLIREGKSPVTATILASSSSRQTTPIRTNIVEPQPGTSKAKPPMTRQEPQRRIGTAEELIQWKALARGLSGTRVKRFWKKINEGMPAAEAKAEVLKGYVKKPKTEVPSRQATSKPMGKRTQKGNTKANCEAPKRSYAKAVASVKMAVFAKSSPIETLTKDQLTWISEAILDAVMEEKNVKVKFDAIQFRPETLSIDCSNEQSAKWLTAAVEKLAGWDGPQLMATTADKAPKNTTINVVFPRAAQTSTEKILGMIDHQNDDLRIDSWKVIKETIEGEAKRLIIGIDDNSLEAINKQRMELSYRYGTISVYTKPPKATDTTDDPNIEKRERSGINNSQHPIEGDQAETPMEVGEEGALEPDTAKSTKDAKQESEDELLSDLEYVEKADEVEVMSDEL